MRYLLLLFFLVACQAAPTKVFETTPTKDKSGTSIRPGTVVLDARPDFDFSVSHLHGALSVHWQDFAQSEEPFLGELEPDLFFHARRLARMGIRPFTPVIVIGRGLMGEGEEGRLAWTLRVLGLSDVQTRTLDSFSVPLTLEPPPPPVEAAIWKPEVDESLIVARAVFVKQIMKPAGPSRPVVIDVRSESEYLGKDGNSRYSRSAPDVGAINIPWTQFLSKPQAVAERLQILGVAKDQQIYVIDNLGVRSAAVTLILRDLGFSHSANFAGGYMELLGVK